MVFCNLQGAVTIGRISREATLQLSVEMSTALTSETTASELFRDTTDASNGAVELAGRASRAATEQYQSALRLQNLTGQVWCGGLGCVSLLSTLYRVLTCLLYSHSVCALFAPCVQRPAPSPPPPPPRLHPTCCPCLSCLELLTLVAPCLHRLAPSQHLLTTGLHPSCPLSAAFWHDTNRHKQTQWI